MSTKTKYPFFTDDAPKDEVEAIIAMAKSEQAALLDEQWLKLESAWYNLTTQLRRNGKFKAWLMTASQEEVKRLADSLPPAKR